MSTVDPQRTRTHTALGLALGVLAFADLAAARRALHGRDAFAAFVGRPGVLAAIGMIAALLLVVAHAALALRRSVREPEASEYPDGSVRSLQRLAGVFSLPFVLLRVVESPLGAALRGLDGYGLYQSLRDELGRPGLVAVQCVGIAAVATHLYQGLAAVVARRGAGRLAPVAFLVAAAYFVLWLDVLAYFITGRALSGAS